MNSRTILLAVLGVVIAAGAVWYFFMQDEVVAPQAMPAKPAPKMEAKPAAPGGDPAKPAPVAAAPGAAPAASGPRDIATVERELKASQARVGQLEKQSADLQRQIEAKNKEIAAMEKKVAGK